MGVLAKMLGLNNGDTVLAVGGDHVMIAVGTDGTPWRMPAFVTIETKTRRILAVGEEALQMRGREPANLSTIKFAVNGGFAGTEDIAEAALRYALRRKAGARIVAPRVVIICPDAQKRQVKDACTHAGAREVISVRSAMAAALGLGLKVEQPEGKAVFVLERDWCAFGLISLSGFITSFELPFGTDALLEDAALHALATRNVVLDLDALHAGFLVSGLTGGDMLGWEAWLDELESGRVTTAAYAEKDFSRRSLPWLLRLRWHYRHAMEATDKTKRRDGGTAPLHFCSPYAKLPGMASLVGKSFLREISVPDAGEFAMARGGQVLLKSIDELRRIAALK